MTTHDDATSTVTSQREVKPTHAGPGTNWTAVVLGIVAFVLVGFIIVSLI